MRYLQCEESLQSRRGETLLLVREGGSGSIHRLTVARSTRKRQEKEAPDEKPGDGESVEEQMAGEKQRLEDTR